MISFDHATAQIELELQAVSQGKDCFSSRFFILLLFFVIVNVNAFLAILCYFVTFPNLLLLPQSLWNLASLTWSTKIQMVQREWNMQCPEMLG